jgi:hypothetical protein
MEQEPEEVLISEEKSEVTNADGSVTVTTVSKFKKGHKNITRRSSETHSIPAASSAEDALKALLG